MRITLDTNILVSAFISKEGQPAKILDLALTFQEIRLILSETILREFREVMLREEVRERFGYSARDIESFVQLLREVSSMVAVKSRFRAVKDDPNDDIVVNTAVDGKAEWIVSGDVHLRKMRVFRGIRIVTPREMLRIVARRFGRLIISPDEIG
jgi:putative PIN family toxin of toxin-antitoxin system